MALPRIEFIASTDSSRVFLTSVYMYKPHKRNIKARRKDKMFKEIPEPCVWRCELLDDMAV
jgi:hypothetical protein